jgi:hypothetical protein
MGITMRPKRPGQGRRILLAGVELEGGWREPPSGIGTQHSDASVHIDAPDIEYVGEFVSPPIAPSKLPQWIESYYPDAVSDSCGMHVHFSVRWPYHYSRLMDGSDSTKGKDRVSAWKASELAGVPFWPYLYSSLNRWGKRMRFPRSHPSFERLRGDNEFCRATFDPDEQAKAQRKTGARYGALNFAYRQHTTCEIRVLPAFEEVHIASRCVAFVLRSVERYLQTLPDADPIGTSETILADPPYVQSTTETIAPWEDPVASPCQGSIRGIDSISLQWPQWRARV